MRLRRGMWIIAAVVAILLGVTLWQLLAPRLNMLHRAVLRPGEQFAGELSPDLYDCTLTVVPGAETRGESTVALLLEGTPGENHTQVVIGRDWIAVSALQRGGRQIASAPIPVKMAPGSPYQLTILRRGELLGLLHDGKPLFVEKVPHGEGSTASIIVGRGWTARDISASSREPVAFSDDFMRAKDEPGSWETVSGTWRLQTAWDDDPHGNSVDRFKSVIYAQNPFAWYGQAAGTSAICIAGSINWEDYTLTAAVRPAGGAVGLAANLSDARNGYLARWSAANDRGPRGDRLQLLQLTDGKPRLLAEKRGGFVPGQWYALSVDSNLEGLRVLVDGEERLAYQEPAQRRGKVGLYVEGKDGVTFDDITAYGSTFNTDLVAEAQAARVPEGIATDKRGMQQWFTGQNDWTYTGRLVAHRHEFYGDHRMVLHVTPWGNREGTLVMILSGDGQNEEVGDRAVITREGDTHTFTLYHEGRQLARATDPSLHTGEEYTLRLSRIGTLLRLQCDGETVCEAEDDCSPRTHTPAYRADGCFGGMNGIYVLGRNFLDYSFAGAPTDWIGEGKWLATQRWACQPKYSFYSGWSRGDAVLWHKRRFSGDQALQIYSAFKMEYPRETNFYDQHTRYHDACLTLCGDGHDPRSGYALATGLPDDYGTPNSRTILYRNGEPVATANESVPGWGGNHFTWYDLTLRKRSSTVEFLIKDRVVISYRDPHPIDGGVPAIWTTDNGLSIARARLSFANPPVIRNDPRVFLDDPWFPEWMETGKSLALDFPNAFSTTGKPVRLQVRARQAPAGAPLPSISSHHVTFTPGKAGYYWYQITATDGKNTSPAFNLFLTAYNPGSGRDDSHAVALYRFDERSGSVIHDKSRISPRLDLHVPAESKTLWLPEQGLSFQGPAPINSETGAKKLMALKRSRAATLELWVSTDSSYPPDHWLGSLLTWGKGNRQRNFLVGIHMNTFVLQPPGGRFQYKPPINNFPDVTGSFTTYGIRTSLQHLLITWDGTTTNAYANGVLLGSGNIPWKPEKWAADAPLLLGNQQDEGRNYLGTYYLVAIHDKCFSPAEVQRHYEAGPGAR